MQHGFLDAPIEIQRQGEDLSRQHFVIYGHAVQCIIVWCNYWDAKEMGREHSTYIEGSVGDAQCSRLVQLSVDAPMEMQRQEGGGPEHPLPSW